MAQKNERIEPPLATPTAAAATNDRPDVAAAASRRPAARRPLRRFFQFLLILMLLCGLYVLATNGVYYWYSRPPAAVCADVAARLDAGLPDDVEPREDRLAFYQSCTDQLAGQAETIDSLNKQVWAFAVLIREDLSLTVPRLQDRAARGLTAVEAYFTALQAIKESETAFREMAGDPPDGAEDTLAVRLDWYAERIAGADALEAQYADMTTITDIDLAGRLATRTELGLEDAAAEISAYREQVLSLQDLISRSDALEVSLDALYAKDPNTDELPEVRAGLGQLLADQEALTSEAAALRDSLPQPLQPVFETWQTGLSDRTVFIRTLQLWWRDVVLAAQSIDSARTDRATAKRYIADSLTEDNVETAYLWTRTAEQYQTSMATAIDFANIYLDRANGEAAQLTLSRESYRPALGRSADVRLIEPVETIDPEAFWLSND